MVLGKSTWRPRILVMNLETVLTYQIEVPQVKLS